MLGSRIDELLGPDDGEPRGPRRDSWLREWPLLLGLAFSLALIAGAMVIGGPEAPPVSVAKADAVAADFSDGQVVDVGDDEVAAAGDPSPADGSGRQAKRRRPKKAGKRSAAVAPDPSVATAQPSDRKATGGSGDTSTGGKSTSGAPRQPSNGGAATPGKIVNVTGTSASITNGPLGYRLTAPTHTPQVGAPWRLSLSATRSGKPLSGRVKIDILHDGAIVGHATSGNLNGGRFAHDFDWPTESVGHPLTVKTTIIGGGFQQSFLFDVKVRAAA
jgi:hypothetical protein